MSGPKSSRYTVSLQRQLMIQAQIQRERERQLQQIQKRIQEERERERRIQEQIKREIERQSQLDRKKLQIEILRQNAKRLSESVSGLQAVIKQAEHHAMDASATPPDFSATHDLCKRIMEEAKRANSLGNNNSPEQLEQASQTLFALMNEVQKEDQRVREYVGQQDVIIREEAIRGFLSGFELSFANLSKPSAKKPSQQEEQTASRFIERIRSELDKLIGLTISDEQRHKFEALRQRADEIDSPDYLESFLSVAIIPFVKECVGYDRLYQQHGEDYEVLKVRYQQLAVKLKHQPESITFSPQAVSILLERIAALETEELKAAEEAYICECIDEAMSEMNYSVIGSRQVKKKNGRQFRNVLYRFDEGTAVNVTYSSDGQITMELGGMSSTDRTPTEAEGRSLEEDMQTFCDDFYEIEKKLKAKGIETKRITHLPAEAQFAQIINVSDYQMTGEIDEYEARADRRRSSGSAATVLHREG